MEQASYHSMPANYLFDKFANARSFHSNYNTNLPSNFSSHSAVPTSLRSFHANSHLVNHYSNHMYNTPATSWTSTVPPPPPPSPPVNPTLIWPSRTQHSYSPLPSGQSTTIIWPSTSKQNSCTEVVETPDEVKDDTGSQCKTKIKNLTDEYKKVSDSNKRSGNSRQTFNYYEEIDEILGTRDSTEPKFVAEVGSEVPRDSSSSSTEVGTDGEINDESNKDKEPDIDVDIEETASISTGKRNRSERKVEKKRSRQRREKSNSGSDDLDVLTAYLEDSEKREREFFLCLAAMDREREERQQENNMKMMAEIAKILKG